MKKILLVCFITIMCLFVSNVYADTTIFYDTRGTKYEGVVERIANLNIINGLNSTTYAPNKSVTRAELAKIIVKMRGIEDYAESVEYKKKFSDVKNTDWYYPYIMIASDLELLNGYSDGTFKPEKEVSYAELVAILLRNLGYTRLSEDSENGWYWNYIVKMREIELNDNVGEFNYEDSATRGDVAMFVWNALITNRWAIVSDNETSGFTYTYSDATPLETFFSDYCFLDNEYVSAVGGFDGKPMVVTKKGSYDIEEKVPLYVLGGNVTGLYKKGESTLIGVTFDEKYQNEKIVSGPIFYLKEQGYNLSKAKKSVSYGSKNDANYAYLILGENGEILRAIYIDTTDTFIVTDVSVSEKSGDNDELIYDITLNGNEFDSTNSALVKNSQGVNWKNLKKDDILTNLGNGLYMYSTATIREEITDIEGKTAMWLANEKYIVSDDCIYYTYDSNESEEYSLLSSRKLEEFIGTTVKVYLNVGEEICKIEFGKTKSDNEKYKIGYVTKVRDASSDSIQSVDYMVSTAQTLKAKITNSSDSSYVEIGDLIAVWDDDQGIKYSIITSDHSFSNDIAIKSEYDAKTVDDQMIGEYIVDSSTKFYKVILRYKNNSITKIEKCTLEDLKLDDINDLLAYKITLVYDENMRILRVYAVSEENKFDNQIALVKDKRVIREGEDKYSYKVTLSVAGSSVRAYEVSESEYLKYSSGDIVAFVSDEKDSEKIIFEEAFKKESIGYKRDLIVEDFDEETKLVMLSDGTILDLNKDIYTWNGSKINLNEYRILYAKVSKSLENSWRFVQTEMFSKADVKVQKGDRIAIGELDNLIVIYSGYGE